MSSPSLVSEASRERPATTLGDVLGPFQTTGDPSERDWVELIAAIAEGKHEALHTLYQRINRIVFTLALRITRHSEVAEEVTLDVFHAIWERAASYDPAGGSVFGWVMNQTQSRSIDRLRREGRKKRVNPYPRDPSDAIAQPGPYDTMLHVDECKHLEQALSVLSVDERAAIEAAYFGELTYAEVAQQLEQPLGTIKSRIRSGLGKLRKTLFASTQ